MVAIKKKAQYVRRDVFFSPTLGDGKSMVDQITWFYCRLDNLYLIPWLMKALCFGVDNLDAWLIKTLDFSLDDHIQIVRGLTVPIPRPPAHPLAQISV